MRARLHALRDGQDGFTLVEVIAGLAIVMVTMAALLAALITGVKAGRVAEGRARANQIAADELERLRYIDWARLGFYDSDFATFPAFHDGESVVKLGAVPAGGRGDAPAPTRTVTVDGKSYTVETWVLWSGSSTTDPNDGTKFAAKRIAINVSYVDHGATRTVSTEGLRAPLPTEMTPPAGGNAVVVPLSLSSPSVQSDQTLTAAGDLTQTLLLSVTADTGADSVEASYVDGNGVQQKVALGVDVTGKFWSATVPAGTGPFSPGTLQVTFTATRAGVTPVSATASVSLTTTSSSGFAITDALITPIQSLDSGYKLTQSLTVSLVTTSMAQSVQATYKLNDGSTRTLTLTGVDGLTWTGTLPVGTGPFTPGNVDFNILATSSSRTATAIASVALNAPFAGAPAVETAARTDREICMTAATIVTLQNTQVTVGVKNMSATDRVDFSIGGWTGTDTTGVSAGSGEFTFEVTIPAGTVITNANGASITLRRSDGVTQTVTANNLLKQPNGNSGKC